MMLPRSLTFSSELKSLMGAALLKKFVEWVMMDTLLRIWALTLMTTCALPQMKASEREVASEKLLENVISLYRSIYVLVTTLWNTCVRVSTFRNTPGRELVSTFRNTPGRELVSTFRNTPGRELVSTFRNTPGRELVSTFRNTSR